MKHACDGGVLSGEDGSNDPKSSDPETESSPCYDSEAESSRSSDSVATLSRPAAFAASIRVFSDSLLRTVMAEMEMVKARENARWDAEKRRMETEAELTRMALQTQLQAVSFALGRKIPTRKRKRVQEHEPPAFSREMALLFLSLLQLNLIFWNPSPA